MYSLPLLRVSLSLSLSAKSAREREGCAQAPFSEDDGQTDRQHHRVCDVMTLSSRCIERKKTSENSLISFSTHVLFSVLNPRFFFSLFSLSRAFSPSFFFFRKRFLVQNNVVQNSDDKNRTFSLSLSLLKKKKSSVL